MIDTCSILISICQRLGQDPKITDFSLNFLWRKETASLHNFFIYCLWDKGIFLLHRSFKKIPKWERKYKVFMKQDYNKEHIPLPALPMLRKNINSKMFINILVFFFNFSQSHILREESGKSLDACPQRCYYNFEVVYPPKVCVYNVQVILKDAGPIKRFLVFWKPAIK